MRRYLLTGSLLLIFGLAVYLRPTSVHGQDAGSAELARGRYIVHDVAQCIQCHTPRDSRGTLDMNRLLQGAPIPMESPYPNRPWAFRAPAIAGLPAWDSADAVHLLMTGARISGQVPRAPMPQFRMTREDAQAVVAYLKSLH